MKLFNYLKQRIRNKKIKANASDLEKEAIRLINKYSKHIKIYSSGNIRTTDEIPSAIPLREASLGGPVYSRDYLMMKNFLKKYPDYETRPAKKIREYYSLFSSFRSTDRF